MAIEMRRALRWPRQYLTVFLIVVAVGGIGLASSPAQAQSCPSKSIGNCRAGGNLVFNGRVWLTECGPNTFIADEDTVCADISACPAAGGFGKFLKAVTGHCRSKHFAGHFGLDGLTFGILDWTADNLPELLRTYRQQSPASFDQAFGEAQLPMQNSCLDPGWTCETNRSGAFMCNPLLALSFKKALHTAEFQKAQASEALETYERRLKRFAPLHLQSEYGNVAMVVVGNNLVDSAECKPETWKKACAGKPDEKSMVDCMLDRYVEHACRGSFEGSRRRREVIRDVFKSPSDAAVTLPSRETVFACSANWGN